LQDPVFLKSKQTLLPFPELLPLAPPAPLPLGLRLVFDPPFPFEPPPCITAIFVDARERNHGVLSTLLVAKRVRN
jgi:hypothetical protein